MVEQVKKPTVKQLQKEQENLTEQLMYANERVRYLQERLEYYETGVSELNDKIEELEIQLAYERSGLFSRIMKKVGLGV